ncbi:MAG TPA: hypothetical protein VKF84_12500 [Candidatus Sulfotelmatobacter sp.]|nr:hypothetical protein [Candidatus Sulfotelmatobacter sp.]
MPSLADLIFLALLGALVFTPLSVKLLNDAGIGWHIRNGQHILATHTIPRFDSFSFILWQPWFAWEWLYDIAVGKLEAWCGLNGVVWLTAVVIATVFAGTFRLAVARGTNLLLALLLTLLAISASMIHFLARPHVLSWLFVLAWFWILDSTDRDGWPGLRARWLWALPLSMLLWVNVHGGFLLGFVLLGIYWLGSLWTWLTAHETRLEDSLRKIAAGRRVRQLTGVGLLSIAATFINPYGWKLHAHIYGYLSNRFLMDHIDEFQSPNFHGIAQKCFLALLLIAIAALAAGGRKLRLSEILLLLFAVYAGLYASRNIPVSSVLLVLLVGPLRPSLKSWGFAQRMSVVDSRLRGHLWPILATAAVLMIAASGGRVGSSQWMNAHFDPRRMPVEAVNFIERSGVRAPILSPDYWGGYLIYQLYPHNPVVIDDRHDFYGEPFLRLYLKMIHVEPDWDEFFKVHLVGYLLLPRSAALTTVIRATPGWKPIYSDDVAILFMRTGLSHEDSDHAPSR